MMPAWRKAWCRWRGHDDSLRSVGTLSGARFAVVECARCNRRVLVPDRTPEMRTLAQQARDFGFLVVDASALTELQLGCAVNGAVAASLLDGGAS